MADLTSPDRSFGHNLRQANRLTQRLLAQRVADMGLNIAQWYALRALWEEDGITQSALAERASIAGPAIVAAVAGLVERGLLERQPHPDDRRKLMLRLTAAGHDLRDAGLRASLDVNAEVLRSIEPGKVQTTLEVLRRVQANTADGASQIHQPSGLDGSARDGTRSGHEGRETP